MAAEPIAASSGDVANPTLRLLPPARERVTTPPDRRARADAAKRDLAFIEGRLGRRIERPAVLTADDLGLIAHARAALEYGDTMLPLQSLELPAGWPLAMRLLKDFAGGVVRSLRLFSETGERLSLFGVDVLLGQTVMVVPQAKLANEQAVRAWLAEAPAGDASCVLRFVTDRIDTVRFWYPDWMTDGRHRMSPTSASEQNLGEADHIAIEFPGRWRVEVTAERSAFADRLDDAVLVAIEHLDHDEQEAVFGALAVLFGWRPERERDWSSRRLPDTGYTFLQLTDRLGMVVQPGDEGAPPRVVEIVRPSQLRSYLNGG